MKIHYNITGEKRKALAEAVGQELNQPVSYLGAPSFSYKVDNYYIDKKGTLIGEDKPSLVADLQGLHSFVAINAEFELPTIYEESNQELCANEIFYNLKMTEAEELGLGKQRRDYQGENGMLHSDIPEPEERNTMTIELPRLGFTDIALENLDSLIKSKETLIKKAIGIEALPVIRTEDTLKFPWFSFNVTSEEVNAYVQFIGALCAEAKKMKRVTVTEKPTENEKFTFRVFLIRLGFVGNEYKSARKILLKNLSGNSAFRKGVPTKTEVLTDE